MCRDLSKGPGLTCGSFAHTNALIGGLGLEVPTGVGNPHKLIATRSLTAEYYFFVMLLDSGFDKDAWGVAIVMQAWWWPSGVQSSF